MNGIFFQRTLDYSLLRVKCPFCRDWTEVRSLVIDRALRTNQDILTFMEVAENTSNIQEARNIDIQQIYK